MLDNLSANFEKLNSLIKKLHKESNKRNMLDDGLDIANEFMHILGVPSDFLNVGDDALDLALPNSKFKNQKMEGWFEKHPYMSNARIALYHYQGDLPIESMFYQLSESPRQEKISATTQLFPNWEDSELTMIPSYKVGVDFFLSTKTRAILVVISKKTNLRVLELSEYLTNTQKEILDKIKNIALYDGIDPQTHQKIQFEPQRTIHTTLWNAFELKEVNKKFYIGIADHFAQLCQHLNHNCPSGINDISIVESAKIFSSRLIGRLLFIWFLKKKGIINNKFDYFNLNDISSTDYYNVVLKKLFFDTLNTPISDRNKNSDLITPYLNGGLFEAHDNDWYDKIVSFPENWFITLYNHLNMFNFTTDESSPEYEQVAIDPEMLGRVFENLLASIVPETAEAANERNKKGAFYTPREIVNYMCKSSLKSYLEKNASSEKDFPGIDMLINLSDAEFLMRRSTGMMDLWGIRTTKVREDMINAINHLKIIDPACGSGAFPIGMLQLLLKVLDRLGAYYDKEIDEMRIISANEHNDLYLTKLYLIRNTLYGCDIEPMAVEISRLRAWLSLIIDDKKDVEPLPNLDFNFVCANTLLPLSEGTYNLFYDANEYNKKFNIFLTKYFNTHDKVEKNKLKREFDLLFEENTEFASESSKLMIEQLKSWNPFSFTKPAMFFDPEKMLNISKFDIVIGNPPYVSVKKISTDDKNIFRDLYFSAQGRFNLFELFIERSISLLNSNGTLCFIQPEGIFTNVDYQYIREVILKNGVINFVMLFDNHVFESADVDTAILCFSKTNLENNKIRIYRNLESDYFEIDQKSIDSKSYYLIPVATTSDNSNILNKMKENCDYSIEDLLEVQQGIIYSGQPKEKVFSNEKKNELFKKCLDGRDVHKWYIKWEDKVDNKYIEYTNKLHRPREERLFLAKEKILLARKSTKISCGYDDKQYYALNTAYICLPLNEKINLKFVLGVLNSKLMNYYYKNVFLGWQITIPAFYSLPIKYDEIISGKVVQEVDKILNHEGENIKEYEDNIDTLIYKLYNLTEDEIRIVESDK